MEPRQLREMQSAARRIRMAESRELRLAAALREMEVAAARDREERQRAEIDRNRAERALAQASERAERAVASELAHRDRALRAVKKQLQHLLGALHAVPHGGYLGYDEIAELVVELPAIEAEEWSRQ